MSEYKLYNGNCLDELKKLEDNSVDSIVTDPPYGLSFMGKKWDYDVPSVEIWEECLRVLKPGGHLLAFAGTRTQHRMAVRIEDAGFEIRDMIAWVYGSGFPKSMDVSKSIDKDNGKKANLRKFTAWFSSVSKDKSNREIDEFLGLDSGGATAAHYRCVNGKQPRFPRLSHYYRLKDWFGFGDEWDAVIEEAEREVVGVQKNAMSGWSMSGQSKFSDRNITTPATDAARRWQGWGTALKPALEPITVARKPLIGTVAANVLEHGTGALNIDGCRVGTVRGVPASLSKCKTPNGVFGEYGGGHPREMDPNIGRFPANLIHDGSDEVLDVFPQAPGQMSRASTDGADQENSVFGALKHVTKNPQPRVDTGSAARFFYCAKASKRDRDEGLEGLESKSNMRVNAPRASEDEKHATRLGNHHPTVKPTDLMRYLCRLITPPNGTVLDPFMGSGSTGKAAMLEWFNFIGIELDPEYIKIAEARIKHAKENSEYYSEKESKKKKAKSETKKQDSAIDSLFEGEE